MNNLINEKTYNVNHFKDTLNKIKADCGENSYEYVNFLNKNINIILKLPIEQIYFYARENRRLFTKDNILKIKKKVSEIPLSSKDNTNIILNFILYVFTATEQDKFTYYLTDGEIPVVEIDEQKSTYKHIPYSINLDALDKKILDSKNANICYQYAKEIQNRDLPKLLLINKLGKVVIDSKDQNINFKFAIDIFNANVEAHKKVITDENLKSMIDEQIKLRDSMLIGEDV